MNPKMHANATALITPQQTHMPTATTLITTARPSMLAAEPDPDRPATKRRAGPSDCNCDGDRPTGATAENSNEEYGSREGQHTASYPTDTDAGNNPADDTRNAIEVPAVD